MKVYLLTEGGYDRRVTAVFEDKEDAEKAWELFSKRFHLPDYYQVEEYDLIQKGHENITISDEWLQCEYDFITKETNVIVFHILHTEDSYDLGEHIVEFGTQNVVYKFYKQLNMKNLSQIDKIIAEKVKPLEYELNVLCGGDMKHFLNHMKSKGVPVS